MWEMAASIGLVDEFSPEDILEDVDAIVVTFNFYFKEIEDRMMRVVDCPILNFADILYEI